MEQLAIGLFCIEVDAVSPYQLPEYQLLLGIRCFSPPDHRKVGITLVAPLVMGFPRYLGEKGGDVLDQVVKASLEKGGVPSKGYGAEQEHQVASDHSFCYEAVVIRVLTEAGLLCPAEECPHAWGYLHLSHDKQIDLVAAKKRGKGLLYSLCHRVTPL